jgi:hypothetical protein
MIDLSKIRISLTDKIVAAMPVGVTVYAYPPDDLLDAPLVYLDLASLSGSLSISGGTAVRIPVVVISTRTDREHSLDRLEELAAIVWAVLGDGKSIELPPGARASCRTADPEQQTNADTTWPAMRFAVDFEVGLTC